VFPEAQSSEVCGPIGTLIDEAKRQRPDLALAEKQEEDTRLFKGSRNALLPELTCGLHAEQRGSR